MVSRSQLAKPKNYYIASCRGTEQQRKQEKLKNAGKATRRQIKSENSSLSSQLSFPGYQQFSCNIKFEFSLYGDFPGSKHLLEYSWGETFPSALSRRLAALRLPRVSSSCVFSPANRYKNNYISFYGLSEFHIVPGVVFSLHSLERLLPLLWLFTARAKLEFFCFIKVFNARFLFYELMKLRF